jgi:hypothetical protein
MSPLYSLEWLDELPAGGVPLRRAFCCSYCDLGSRESLVEERLYFWPLQLILGEELMHAQMTIRMIGALACVDLAT